MVYVLINEKLDIFTQIYTREIVTGNLVEELNGVPFEFFNGVKLCNLC
jgi:hypothetical protein